MTDAPRRAIAWFRRDLRLTDNRMLEAATRAAEHVFPVFVADPDLVGRHAGARARVAWIGANLVALERRLRAEGAGLTVLRGRPEDVLREFGARVGAGRAFASADEDPTAVERDRRVAEVVDLELVDDQRIVPPSELRTRADEPFSVYSPFRRALDAWLAGAGEVALAPATVNLDRLARRPADADGPEAFQASEPPHVLPVAGEEAATSRLRAFLRHDIVDYRPDRDRPDRDVTSHLSPYLRIGAISVRSCWRAAANAVERGRERSDVRLRQSAEAWRGELAWREFFAHVLAAHPRLAREAFRAEYDGLEWVDGADAEEGLAAWRTGHTGYPFVDAGMRQLVATGWMHNRARLVTASFLVKHLGLDWRRGESVFLEHLLDADTQQNNGNWQWVAGVGTDAAPYFRIFNPTLQAKRFDPDGAYIRRWVPELAEVPDVHVHEPWRAPEPPRGYPAPIVDHADARERTLARYRAIGGRS